MGYRRLWLLLPLGLLLSCTRHAWVGPVVTAPAPPGVSSPSAAVATIGAAAPATVGPAADRAPSQQWSVRVTAPPAGARVSSPVDVAALAAAPAGARVVGTVAALDARGVLHWRGNAELRPVGPDRHGGTVPFELEAGGAGVVEVAVVRQSDGTILARQVVSVTLVPGR